jgi:hypothetical protein
MDRIVLPPQFHILKYTPNVTVLGKSGPYEID